MKNLELAFPIRKWRDVFHLMNQKAMSQFIEVQITDCGIDGWLG
jgi:predicted transcriptional regulator